MKHLLFGMIFTVASVASANSALEEKIRECSLIQSDVDRLNCFDLMVQPQSVGQGIDGNWSVSVDIDPLTDSQIVVALIEPATSDSRHDRFMVIRCQSGGDVDIYVGWDAYLGSEVFVTHRFDKGTPTEARWGMSTDSTASFAPNAKSFFEELIRANQLVTKTTPYSESPVILQFDVVGLVDALGSNIDLCR